jgi:hypothetical protein
MSDIVKEALKFLRGFEFELGRELSTIEILRASNIFYNLSEVRVTDCLVGRSLRVGDKPLANT